MNKKDSVKKAKEFKKKKSKDDSKKIEDSFCVVKPRIKKKA